MMFITESLLVPFETEMGAYGHSTSLQLNVTFK